MQATTQQTILASIAILQFGAFIVAGVVAYRQARSHVEMRRLQSTLAILRYVEDRDISHARWFAYEHHKEVEALLEQQFESEFQRLNAVDDLVRKLSGKTLDVHTYLYPVVALNIAGFMIEKKLVRYEDIVPGFVASTFLRTWQAHERFILYRRAQRFLPATPPPPPSYYGYYLENIVKRIENASK